MVWSADADERLLGLGRVLSVRPYFGALGFQCTAPGSGLARAVIKVNERIATHVAEMLASTHH